MTTSLPDGQVGQAYGPITLTATGGVPPYSWSTRTPLPDGLTLSPAGALSGTPQHAGSAPFTVRVADSRGNPFTADENLSVTIARGDQQISFTSNPPTDNAVGDTWAPSAVGGGSGEPVIFLGSGACTAPDGIITFTAVGNCVVSADQAGDADWNPAATAQLTIAVTEEEFALPMVAGGALPFGTVGTPYRYMFLARGGTPPYTFTSDDLPAGLSLDPVTGVMSGTPTASGDLPFTVVVTDSRQSTPPPPPVRAAIIGPNGHRVITRALVLVVDPAAPGTSTSTGTGAPTTATRTTTRTTGTPTTATSGAVLPTGTSSTAGTSGSTTVLGTTGGSSQGVTTTIAVPTVTSTTIGSPLLAATGVDARGGLGLGTAAVLLGALLMLSARRRGPVHRRRH